ncbi:MAG: hypothetical protein HY840_03645 [Bacteroidetes bacterium]|nr:hypothetical protein [Bacteroidota bacterium]
MKKILLSFFYFAVLSSSVAQVTTNTPVQKKATKLHYDEFWITGGIGAGAVVSTNIVNSGAVFPVRTEFLWQRRHRRLGVGFGKELEVTPEQLFNLVLGKKPGISKLYFVYEQYVFRNFPINLGFSSHLGFFGTNDTTNSKGGLFGNIGFPVELGIRPFYLFVRPDIEYQSWSGFHKQIQATATVGMKLKFLSKEEKDRRAAVKAARKKHRALRHKHK